MKLTKKVLLPLSLISLLALSACGKISLDEIDTDIDIVATELEESYAIEYVFEVRDPEGHYDQLAYFIEFKDEKLKAMFPDDVAVSNQANESNIEYKKIKQSTSVTFEKLITVPKETYSSLSEAKAAAEKIKYKITDSQIIKTYSK